VFRALWRRIATGSRGGVLANVRLMLSRQNCIRKAPTVGFETRSGIRASSILSARIAKYASRVGEGMNVWSVNEGESNFLMSISGSTHQTGT